MPTVLLHDRSIIRVSGPDADHLLQNIVTTDLDGLEHGVVKPGALLTPQGKILFDFLIARAGEDGFALECRSDVAADFARRLMLYRLRAKAEISKPEQMVAVVSWHGDSTSSQVGARGGGYAASSPDLDLRDTRFPPQLDVRRRHETETGGGREDADTTPYTRLRIASGVAESGSDYELGDAFPHDVNLDQAGGVGFRKGCYVGQEVVSRMQHRGTARRRVLIVRGASELPPPATAVTIAERPAGVLGSVCGTDGLALVRIDKVKAALDDGVPVLASGVALELSIPPGAGFGFPEAAAAGSD